jgi:cyanophycinase-like exopeptidase
LRLLYLQTPMDSQTDQEVETICAHFHRHDPSIHVTDPGLQDRADAYRREVISAIRDADIVLGSGGDPVRMASVLRDTLALDALREANANGTVVGGGSAGAMVFGAGLLDGPRNNPHPTHLLGWLPDVVIAPHFGNYPIAPWRATFPTETILGLRDGSAVLVTDNGQRITALGDAPATFLLANRSEIELAPGQSWTRSLPGD